MRRDLPWTEAIVKVLEAAGKPLHYSEIAQAIIDDKLRQNVGATPPSTVASILSTSFKSDGDLSQFYRDSRGVYGLRSTLNGPLTSSEPETTLDVDPAEEDAEDTGLINGFGMFWRRNKVNWKRESTRILGRNTPGSEPVDFATQQGVYLLYDVTRVVYVGQVSVPRLGGRLADHTVDRLEGRWDRFSWFGVRPVMDNGQLAAAPEDFSLKNLIDTMETILIEGLEPPLNRRAGSGFTGTEFLQVEDPEIERRGKQRLLEELASSLT